jgi:hypothetical protein
MQDSLFLGCIDNNTSVLNSLVGKNPMYPVYEASARLCSSKWSKTKILRTRKSWRQASKRQDSRISRMALI